MGGNEMKFARHRFKSSYIQSWSNGYLILHLVKSSRICYLYIRYKPIFKIMSLQIKNETLLTTYKSLIEDISYFRRKEIHPEFHSIFNALICKTKTMYCSKNITVLAKVLKLLLPKNNLSIYHIFTNKTCSDITKINNLLESKSFNYSNHNVYYCF